MKKRFSSFDNIKYQKIRKAKYMLKDRIVNRFMLDGKKVIIRYARKNDLEGILEVVQDHRKNSVAMGGKRGLSKKMRNWWRKQLVTNKRAKRITLFVEIDNGIRGGIVVKKSQKNRHLYAPWWVSIIVVIKKYRHRGLGKKLLRAAIFETKKILKAKKIGLQVAAPNIHAFKLYSSCGFLKVDVKKKVKKWRGKLVDYIQMVKQL